MIDQIPFGVEFKILEDPMMADRVQFRFPRTKKRRIRKKWSKRPENYKIVPWPKVYRINEEAFRLQAASVLGIPEDMTPMESSPPTFVMHPATAVLVRQAIKNQEMRFGLAT